MKALKLIRRRFGRLRVIAPAHSVKTRTGGYKMWKCECRCGNVTLVRTSHLTEHRVESCGCLFKEMLSKTPRGRKEPGEAYLRYVFGYYLKNAKLRKLSFEISFDEFCALIVQNCRYCGTEPSLGKNKARLNRPMVFYGTVKHNGLDRVDNALGYTRSNVVPCCALCNRAKRTLSFSDFKTWALRLTAHLAAEP